MPQWRDREWVVFLIGFLGPLFFFLTCSAYQFLDGDDALQAIWALARQNQMDPFQFPLHGFYSRSGAFFLIYLFSFLFNSPQVSYAVLSALGAAMILAALTIYTSTLLGVKPRLAHLLVIVCVAPEVIYAGLYPNAAAAGYGLGFLGILLSARLIRRNGPDRYFIFSGALFGLALAVAMSSTYLVLAFPLQHILLRGDAGRGKAVRRFSYEILAGAAAYSMVLWAMNLGPLAPFTEYSRVVSKYQNAGLQYTLITLLGATSPWSCLIVAAGLVLMLTRRAFPALAVGTATTAVYLIMLGDLLRTFQHALSIFILIALCAVLVLESLPGPRSRRLYLGLLVLPLFFGLRLYLPEQPHRGPGFSEIDPGQALDWDEKDARGLGGFKLGQSPEIKISGRGLRVALGSGFMLPSVDGGRAFGGYFWAWTMDWKPYLDSINRSVALLRESGGQKIVMGQYPVAAIGMYEMVAGGYRLRYDQDPHLFVFEKGGSVISHFWYFNYLAGQVGKKELEFGADHGKFEQALLVSFPSFAYRLEKGDLTVKGYSLDPLGYCCFRMKKRA